MPRTAAVRQVGQTAPSPAALRKIFGQNLRTLIGGRTSVSALCREIDVNRTQFNRYLSGESFPRPDVLFRICQHFGVDARILLEPLDRIGLDHGAGAGQAPEDSPALALRLGQARQMPLDPKMIAPGFYLFYFGPVMQVDRVMVVLVRVEIGSDGVGFADYMLPGALVSLMGLPGGPKRGRSVITQHLGGVAFHGALPGTPILITSFYEPGFLGNPRLFRGQTLTTLRLPPHEQLVSRSMLEQLEAEPQSLLAARRRAGLVPVTDLPGPVQAYFQSTEGASRARPGMPQH